VAVELVSHGQAFLVVCFSAFEILINEVIDPVHVGF
jgi:hypothetical protein